MQRIAIYEPAMCCETGICGVNVDPELLRVSAMINSLKQMGVAIQRFNLTSFPQAFTQNQAINRLINTSGVEELPATVVDGRIVKTKTYPTNAEIAAWLGIPVSYLTSAPPAKNCCAGGCFPGCC